MSLPCQYELKKLRQKVPTTKLVEWAHAAGFVTRCSGTSHIVGKHPEYGITFTIIATTDKLDSKRIFANALIELRKKQEAAAAAEIIADDVHSSMELGRLPAYIVAEQDPDTGNIVLRDSQIPQIGVTIRPDQRHMLENKIRYMEDIKREAYILLSRCRTQFDIDIGDTKGHAFGAIISHKMYDLPTMVFPPYAMGNDPRGFIGELAAYITQVQEKDFAHEERLKRALQHSFVKATVIVFHEQRGERTNVVSYESPAGGKSLRFNFTTASEQRAVTTDTHGQMSINRGRITEQELARVENVMNGIALAHQKRRNAYALQAA